MTDLAVLLDQISDPRIPIMPTVMIWKNVGKPFKYTASVGGMAIDGDDADLALHEAAQKYWRNMQLQFRDHAA